MEGVPIIVHLLSKPQVVIRSFWAGSDLWIRFEGWSFGNSGSAIMEITSFDRILGRA
jgi:hypothetical protein